MKCLWNKSYKALKKLKKTEFHMLMINLINIVKMFVRLKVFYIFSAMPIKILRSFFINIEATILKLIQRHKTKDVQSKPEQKEYCKRYYHTQFQILLQTQSNQNSLALAK